MSGSLPERVLIVEDEAITRWQIHDVLTRIGIKQIHESTDAAHAKELLRQERVDVILMDINLGSGQDGIALTREILQKQHVPVVFVTAYTDDEVFEETIQLSPYGFIVKPFVRQDVERLVRIAYGRFAQERANEEKNKANTQDGVVCIRGGYRYDLNKRLLYKDNQLIPLRGKEAELVNRLCRNAYAIMPYDTLLEQLWQHEMTLSSLRTLVYGLRKKLPDFPITNHSKMGYSIEVI
jgi:DNA-binding response OmpR family regulator